MAKTKSPTQRTLEACAKLGYLADKTEHRGWGFINGKALPCGKLHDLFGFIDVLAIVPTRQGLLGIQCTTADNMNSRCTKIVQECTEASWKFLNAGNLVQVWGWKKYAIHGTKLVRWDARRKAITLVNGAYAVSDVISYLEILNAKEGQELCQETTLYQSDSGTS